MNTYKLNAVGAHYISNFVREHGKEGLNVSSYIDDAETAANEAFDNDATAIIEIGKNYSANGQAFTMTLDQRWFDAEEIA